MNKIFDEKQFVPTEWSSAKEKADFANHLIRFIESGYKESLFNKKFYNRLSMTFGHIAHYNKYGFYDVWFSSRDRQKRFLENIKRCPCYGDPKWTYSDVEKALQQYLSGYTAKGDTYSLSL